MRRFVACAAENGIDVFRLHDPLNDVSNLREAGEAIVAAGKEFHAGLVYSAGRDGRDRRARRAREAAARARRLARDRQRPDRRAAAAPHRGARPADRRGDRACRSGLFVQGAAGTGLLNAVVATRLGADLVATAVYPLALTLHRVSGESLVDSLHGLGRDDGRRRPRTCGRPRTSSTSTSATSRSRPSRRASPCARPSTTCRPASSPRSTSTSARTPPATACSTRSAEVGQIRAEAGLAAARRADRPDPRLAGAAQHPLRASLRHRAGRVPAARRGRLRHDPDADRRVGRARGRRSSTGSGVGLDEDPPSAEDVREAAEGLAASEEDLVLLAMFGERGRDAPADDPPAPLARDVAAHGRRRRDARRADPRARQDRAGVGRRGDRDRGRRHARLRPPRRRGRRGRRRRRSPRSRRSASPSCRSRRPRGARARRVADGRASSTARLARGRRRSSRSATSSPSARRSACSRR